MRFAMRSPTSSATERADLYQAAVDMCAWADGRGALCVLSEHHASDDGYLPSPLPLASAIAARTRTMPITVAALLLPLYEPVKLAEDMAVLDLISRGRVTYVIAIGYRAEEFDLFGIDRRTRGRDVEARIVAMRQLWRGEPAEVAGRTARITPLPYQPGGPILLYGGGTAAAAQRAARLGMLFVAETHDDSLEAVYRAEAAKTGVAPVGCVFTPVSAASTIFVADDPEAAWAEIGEYLFRDSASYAAWNADKGDVASVSRATNVAELQAEHGAYQIVTPAEAAALASTRPLALQPLVGGLPPEIAWRYLETAAAVAGSA
jgi:alkanesulfonate monooxygenase SsuD/methylene tetrahydromethanopterin reductase-like flavin-dependent oxidoreductase (luciferase family)